MWKSISPEGFDLLSQMLARSPSKRITAKQALTHSWFTLEHTEERGSSVRENVVRHQGGGIFDVGRIKPEFSALRTAGAAAKQNLSKFSPAADPRLELYFGRSREQLVRSCVTG